MIVAVIRLLRDSPERAFQIKGLVFQSINWCFAAPCGFIANVIWSVKLKYVDDGGLFDVSPRTCGLAMLHFCASLFRNSRGWFAGRVGLSRKKCTGQKEHASPKDKTWECHRSLQVLSLWGRHWNCALTGKRRQGRRARMAS